MKDRKGENNIVLLLLGVICFELSNSLMESKIEIRLEEYLRMLDGAMRTIKYLISNRQALSLLQVSPLVLHTEHV